MERKKITMDGNHAAAHVSYAYTDVAAIYPITPSTVMAEVTDEWSSSGRKNVFGQRVMVTEMQSEAGAAGAVHGALAAGALTTTFTASQGLLLMIPNLYKMAGERLPGVFDVSARAIASHALSIFGDHSDIYACRQTGAAMLCESSVQEVMDLTPVAHMAAIEGRMPFINFFDGFRTSHEIQKIDAWDYETLKELLDHSAVAEFRENALNPEHPCEMGSAQNPDIFFQTREASNEFYDRMPQLVQQCMDKVNQKIGTQYHLFDYYGAKDAKKIIIAMGSVCSTIEETIDYLKEDVGLVKVRLYRPFSKEALLAAIPKSAEVIYVLDRTKEPGAYGEPLYLDVAAALRDTEFKDVKIYGGRYGLGSKDTTPGQIAAVYENMDKERFTIGVRDDVTHLSLDVTKEIDTAPKGTTSCKFWGLGSDGTVGANKNSIKIIGDHTDLYVQAYFDYDSKKSGGVTMSHLRFGKEPIKSAYLVQQADFVACHNPSYLWKYDMVQDLKEGGTFLLNCPWKEDELDAHLPGQLKRFLAEHGIRFYVIDGVEIGMKTGMGPTRINTILQSAFFALTDIIPKESAVTWMKEAAEKTYGRKGRDVVEKNWAAIEEGAKGAREVNVPKEWINCQDEAVDADRNEAECKNTGCHDRAAVQFAHTIQKAISSQKGNELTVSEVKPYVDGKTPSGTAAFEKRGIAVNVPVWEPEKCIQCNICSYVCPHAVIRPAVMDEEEAKGAPHGMQMLSMTGMEPYHFAITISSLDCTGCGSCVECCPAKGKAITMHPFAEHEEQQAYFDYGRTLKKKQDVTEKFKQSTVKGSQFMQPLLEFSGACGGCGETPYAKLVTQLFGERMYVANATGCSSIWGNSSPSTPYTMTPEGRGPAWSNSLFEDAAEFGYGMLMAQKTMRERLKAELGRIKQVLEVADPEEKEGAPKEICAAIDRWTATYADAAENQKASEALASLLKGSSNELMQKVYEKKDFLSKKSQWVFGGDGFAYDIGFGGLDHVLASGEDINVLVFDTQVYSNTGGQSSKATPLGAVAQFAAAGKEIGRKDLAAIAMSYGYVYVAQVAMGADYNQCVKAFLEAESYPGPSLVIAYAPCISHGIKAGMGKSQLEEKLAVEAGYWYNFRYDPRKKEAGENPFQLDSREPKSDYREFLQGEVRYSALSAADKERAEELFARAGEQSREKYAQYQLLASGK